MTTSLSQKADRLQVRVDSRTKRILSRAAAYSGMSLSGFVVATALKEAEGVIARNETLTASREEWDRFFAALDDPAEPSRKLVDAIRRHHP